MLGSNSALFYAINRNKKSVRLDLKQEQGKEVFCKMAACSDVVLEGFRPGVMERLGLGYDELIKVNPRIIYCAVTGYGQNGPLRDLAGHDINYLNLAGISSLIGHQNEKPAIAGVQLADIGGGSLWSIIAILLALKAREVTGQGQMCDVGMLDGVLSWLPFYMATFSVTGNEPGRGTEILNGGYACYNIYQTYDKKYVSIGALEGKFWAEFCLRIGKKEFITKQLDPDAQNEMIEALTALFKQKTQTEWVEFFADCDICFTPVLEFHDMICNPHVRERQMLYKTVIEGREVILPGIPIKLSHTPGVINPQFSDCGQDTRDILESLGYSPEQIMDLVNNGVI
jgi:crotonobetainyl-CoA:carnitine CoA-transferase CaiB-like acyl-CoA transferase